MAAQDMKTDDLKSLREQLSFLPNECVERVLALCQRGQDLNIGSERVLKYALLLVSVQRSVEGDAVANEHARRSLSELAGSIHGNQRGYMDEETAMKQYMEGRMSRQRLSASLDRVISNLNGFRALTVKHQRSLPSLNQKVLSDQRLSSISAQLESMRRSLSVEREEFMHHRSSIRSVASEVFCLWWNVVPTYRGKWVDMHNLARRWHLSDARDVESFRTIVNRVKKSKVAPDLSSAWTILTKKRN